MGCMESTLGRVIVKLLALALTKLANLVTNLAKQSMANLIINLTKPSLDHDKTWARSRHYNQTDHPTPPYIRLCLHISGCATHH